MIYILLYGVQLLVWLLISGILSYVSGLVIGSLGRKRTGPFIFIIVFLAPFGFEYFRYMSFLPAWQEACQKRNEVVVYKGIEKGAIVFYRLGTWDETALWQSLLKEHVGAFVVRAEGTKSYGVESKKKYWKIQIADKGDQRCSLYEERKRFQSNPLEYMKGKCITVQESSLAEADIKIGWDEEQKVVNEVGGIKIIETTYKTIDMETGEVLKERYDTYFNDRVKLKGYPTIFQWPLYANDLHKCKTGQTNDTSDLILFSSNPTKGA